MVRSRRPSSGAACARSSSPSEEVSCQGTLATITPGVYCSRVFSRSALWLCSTCSHQCPTTYSGT